MIRGWVWVHEPRGGRRGEGGGHRVECVPCVHRPERVGGGAKRCRMGGGGGLNGGAPLAVRPTSADSSTSAFLAT